MDGEMEKCSPCLHFRLQSELRPRLGRGAGGVAWVRARGGRGGRRPRRWQALQEGGADQEADERLHGLGQGWAEATRGREPRPPQRGPLQDAR